jgi:hypothetical protein
MSEEQTQPESSEQPETPESDAKPKRVAIDIPKDLEPVYANVAFISHTAAEIILDMAQVLPRVPRGKVVSRIVMSPMHAKLLMRALSQNVANYERQFGEIRFPRSLADELFNYPPSDSPSDE